MKTKRYPSPHGIIQVYPAEQWHDSVYIVANWKALLNLALMLFKAIIRGRSTANVWASDGEGYSIEIMRTPDGWDTPLWKNLKPHYQTRDYGEPDGIDPVYLFHAEEILRRKQNG